MQEILTTFFIWPPAQPRQKISELIILKYNWLMNEKWLKLSKKFFRSIKSLLYMSKNSLLSFCYITCYIHIIVSTHMPKRSKARSIHCSQPPWKFEWMPKYANSSCMSFTGLRMILTCYIQSAKIQVDQNEANELNKTTVNNQIVLTQLQSIR